MIKILKILEHSKEKDERRKERNESKSNKESKSKGKSSKDKSKSEKPKNPCKLLNHSNHDWANCYNNPKSKNFKGTAKNWKDEPKKGEEANLIELLEEESVSGDEEYHQFQLDPQKLFSFKLLARLDSESEDEESSDEGIPEEKEEPPSEESEVQELMDRTSNKRKRLPNSEEDPCEDSSKIMAIEAASPQPEFPAIETKPSSMKKKLEAVPMLNYDFCSALVATEYDSDKEMKPLDERKPTGIATLVKACLQQKSNKRQRPRWKRILVAISNKLLARWRAREQPQTRTKKYQKQSSRK